MKITEGSGNRNRDNVLIKTMLCKNLSHGMTSGASSDLTQKPI